MASKSAARIAHEKDIAAITAAMLKAAEDYGMCEAFDEVVAELNKVLTVRVGTRQRSAWFDVIVRVECLVDYSQTQYNKPADSDDRNAESVVARSLLGGVLFNEGYKVLSADFYDSGFIP